MLALLIGRRRSRRKKDVYKAWTTYQDIVRSSSRATDFFISAVLIEFAIGLGLGLGLGLDEEDADYAV